MSSLDKLQEVELLTKFRRVKSGNSTEYIKTRRLSFYFNFLGDSHHIEFDHDARRDEIVQLLQNLSQLIKEGSK